MSGDFRKFFSIDLLVSSENYTGCFHIGAVSAILTHFSYEKTGIRVAKPVAELRNLPAFLRAKCGV
jgi:hypothetical protein